MAGEALKQEVACGHDKAEVVLKHDVACGLDMAGVGCWQCRAGRVGMQGMGNHCPVAKWAARTSVCH